MTILFNIMDLRELLHDFYTLSGIRVVIFDDEFHEIAAYPSQHSAYCQLIRSDSQAENKCIHCDNMACQTCRERQHFYTYKCHAGLTETVVPINADGIVIAYIMFGQVLQTENSEQLWSDICDKVQDYNIDMALLHAAYKRKDIITDEVLAASARMMEVSANYLYLSRKISLREDSLLNKMNTYITDHIKEKLTVPILCGHFSLSKSHLYKFSAQNYGMGIAKYIRHIRVQKSKILLCDTDAPINEVANEVGIPDYNYFTKIFKAETGITPKAYRKQYNRSLSPIA